MMNYLSILLVAYLVVLSIHIGIAMGQEVDIKTDTKPSTIGSSPSDDNDDGSDNVVDAINQDKDITVQNTSAKSSISSATVEDEKLSIWPQNDELDKRMMKIALPCIANFAINPLIGAVDLFWVNRSKYCENVHMICAQIYNFLSHNHFTPHMMWCI